MRDRLIELLKVCLNDENIELDYGFAGFDIRYEKIADYLIANGVIVPPCWIGDTVYQVDSERVYELKVKNVIYDTPHIAFDSRAVGNGLIFLTKEEAVKEFAERLCADRVSNDPVVIAVKAELKEMG
jgi:hypothetical protein